MSVLTCPTFRDDEFVMLLVDVFVREGDFVQKFVSPKETDVSRHKAQNKIAKEARERQRKSFDQVLARATKNSVFVQEGNRVVVGEVGGDDVESGDVNDAAVDKRAAGEFFAMSTPGRESFF